MIKTISKKAIAFLLFSSSPFLGMAAGTTAVTSQSSYLTNPLFITMLILIGILLLVIWAIGNVIRTMAGSDIFKDKFNHNGPKDTHALGLVVLFLLATNTASAQNAAASGDVGIVGLSWTIFATLLSIIALEIAAIIVLLRLMKDFVKPSHQVEELRAEKKSAVKEKSIMDTLNASVDIEREQEILLDHDYDGIKELDNNLPPWWKYGFYLTVFVSFIYMIHYHITKTGQLQGEEYKKEVVDAKAKLDAYMLTAANNVDENTIKMLDNAADLEAGKTVYMTSCAVCHGKLGEGGVGPNMADAYWLHGGNIVDIFKSIKYGWPDKGMISWKESLSAMQIAQVSSYLKTLVGTNPPNGKAPQGDLYTEGPAPTDSLAISNDSTKVQLDSLAIAQAMKDSIKTKK